jgi:hypothetical protein
MASALSTDAQKSHAAYRLAVEAHQLGNASAARAALEAALHLDGPDDVKGRAHYYPGAMDHQERRYADARNHLGAAATKAPVQERD